MKLFSWIYYPFSIIWKLLIIIKNLLFASKPKPVIISHGVIDFVTSADGAVIQYRKFIKSNIEINKNHQEDAAVILIHGSMMHSDHFNALGCMLSKYYTVYIPDRRGRASSSPLTKEFCPLVSDLQDIQALVKRTGATKIFGLSSGAIIALYAAIHIKSITHVALYEPPFPLPHRPESKASSEWHEKYLFHLQRGNLAAALVEVQKGTSDIALFSLDKLPRWILTPFFNRLIEQQSASASKSSDKNKAKVTLKLLIPTLQYDLPIVNESVKPVMQQTQILNDRGTKILLLGGGKSHPYLQLVMKELSKLVPQAKFVHFPSLGHVAAAEDPSLVAQELQLFFTHH